MDEEYDDELVQWLKEQMSDPEFVKAFSKSQAELDRSVHKLCGWGTCEVAIDPLNNRIVSAIGLVGCGCDNLPGWRSAYYEGLPKPGWQVKPVGRHGGRIARSRRKNSEHQKWYSEMFPE